VLPFPTTVSPVGNSAAPAALRGPIRGLLLTSLLLAAVAAVAGGLPSHLMFALAISALAAAAVLGMRSRLVAATPDRASVVDVPLDRGDELSARLRELHDDYVEQVNLALDEERHDLVQRLSDSYMDQALALMTTDTEVRR
jgi:hypothetical protein